MAIDTTISLHLNTIMILEYLSGINGLSKSKIIAKSIVIVSTKNQIYRTRSLTEYQSFGGDDFHRMHVYLSEADFQIVFDLRRFYRASFSLLIAQALTLYYDELLELLQRNDNYLCSCHVQIYQTVNNVKIWKHFWGIPPEEEILKE
jgi:hypothetical protein